MNLVESKSAKDWIENHKCKRTFWQKLIFKEIIPDIYYMFLLTGIGVEVVVGCHICGARMDVTGYSCW